MVCPSCYQDYISQCPTSISIKAGLQPDTDYRIWIEDKFSHIDSFFAFTDGNGVLIIDISESQQAVYTPYSGWFKIQVRDIDDDTPVSLTINGTSYDCIEFEVKGGDFQKSYLGEFVEEAANS